MERYEDRLIAGIIKGGLAAEPHEAERLLARDIAINAPAERITMDDLWPCIWALCACLERQFTGTIHINGIVKALPGPAPLSPRCHFDSRPNSDAINIDIGTQPRSPRTILSGDAKDRNIANGTFLPGDAPANPIAAFALAGYLGAAALGKAIGLAPHRAGFQQQVLTMPIQESTALPLDRITLLGLGQLGQAYLALLYFLTQRSEMTVSLLDKDPFELPNQRTQILLSETHEWLGTKKATYLQQVTESWGWTTQADVQEIGWGWERPSHHAPIALVGVDSLDVRRMIIAAKYDWLIDAGLGTSLAQPKISWHSLPPNNQLAAQLFRTRQADQSTNIIAETPFHQQLRNTPGQCGWATFNNITAAAPAMGITAAAYALAELFGKPHAISGRATLWSPFLPYYREPITTRVESSGILATQSRGTKFSASA